MMAAASVASFDVIEPSPSPVRPWLVQTLQNTQLTLPTFTVKVFTPVTVNFSGRAFSMAACNAGSTGRGSIEHRNRRRNMLAVYQCR